MSPDTISGTGSSSPNPRISSWRATPEYCCATVLEWIVTASTSAATRASTIDLQFILPSSGPRRIFAVTGISTASLTVFTILPHRSGSSISADPAPALMTFFTGHPMFTSTNDVLGSSSNAAVAPLAIISASPPKSWTPVGDTPDPLTNLFDSSGLNTSPAADTISVTEAPAPNPSMNVL